MKSTFSMLMLATVCSISFFSCKKNNTDVIQQPSVPKKIYVLSDEETGTNGDYAVRYRVDGRVTTVIDGINYNGMAIDMKVADTNVYVLARRDNLLNSGSEYVVYKNGTSVQTFAANTNSFYAAAVAVNGPDLYVIGQEFVQATGGLKIKYWKNGSFTDVSTANNYTYATAADFIGGSLYISAREDAGTVRNAVLWKDGVKTILPGIAGNQYVIASGFAISGNDIYVSGNSNSQPCVWKNGVLTVLPSPVNLGAANGICVSGNDVYVCGRAEAPSGNVTQAVYWKNGSLVNLTSSGEAEAYDIAVDGSDIHVAGYNSTNGNIYPASYWKNGVETVFTAAGKHGEVKKIIAR